MFIDYVLNDLFIILEVVNLHSWPILSWLALVSLISFQWWNAIGAPLLLNISGDFRQHLGIFSQRTIVFLVVIPLKETIRLIAGSFVMCYHLGCSLSHENVTVMGDLGIDVWLFVDGCHGVGILSMFRLFVDRVRWHYWTGISLISVIHFGATQSWICSCIAGDIGLLLHYESIYDAIGVDSFDFLWRCFIGQFTVLLVREGGIPLIWGVSIYLTNLRLISHLHFIY